MLECTAGLEQCLAVLSARRKRALHRTLTLRKLARSPRRFGTFYLFCKLSLFSVPRKNDFISHTYCIFRGTVRHLFAIRPLPQNARQVRPSLRAACCPPRRTGIACHTSRRDWPGAEFGRHKRSYRQSSSARAIVERMLARKRSGGAGSKGGGGRSGLAAWVRPDGGVGVRVWARPDQAGPASELGAHSGAGHAPQRAHSAVPRLHER